MKRVALALAVVAAVGLVAAGVAVAEESSNQVAESAPTVLVGHHGYHGYGHGYGYGIAPYKLPYRYYYYGPAVPRSSRVVYPSTYGYRYYYSPQGGYGYGSGPGWSFSFGF